MVFPTIILGILFGCTIGCVFHFWRGGGFKWLVLDNIFAIAGFWLGHFIAGLVDWKFLALGPINLGGSLIGALLFVFGGFWLSMARVEQNQKN